MGASLESGISPRIGGPAENKVVVMTRKTFVQTLVGHLDSFLDQELLCIITCDLVTSGFNCHNSIHMGMLFKAIQKLVLMF